MAKKIACSPQETTDLKGSVEETLGSLSKAVGHPARVKILQILIAKGECVSGDLAEEFALAQSTVSEHLRILKEAGLVQGTIDGPRRCYCVNGGTLRLFKRLVADL